MNLLPFYGILTSHMNKEIENLIHKTTKLKFKMQNRSIVLQSKMAGGPSVINMSSVTDQGHRMLQLSTIKKAKSKSRKLITRENNSKDRQQYKSHRSK